MNEELTKIVNDLANSGASQAVIETAIWEYNQLHPPETKKEEEEEEEEEEKPLPPSQAHINSNFWADRADTIDLAKQQAALAAQVSPTLVPQTSSDFGFGATRDQYKRIEIGGETVWHIEDAQGNLVPADSMDPAISVLEEEEITKQRLEQSAIDARIESGEITQEQVDIDNFWETNDLKHEDYVVDAGGNWSYTGDANLEEGIDPISIDLEDPEDVHTKAVAMIKAQEEQDVIKKQKPHTDKLEAGKTMPAFETKSTDDKAIYDELKEWRRYGFGFNVTSVDFKNQIEVIARAIPGLREEERATFATDKNGIAAMNTWMSGTNTEGIPRAYDYGSVERANMEYTKATETQISNNEVTTGNQLIELKKREEQRDLFTPEYRIAENNKVNQLNELAAKNLGFESKNGIAAYRFFLTEMNSSPEKRKDLQSRFIKQFKKLIDDPTTGTVTWQDSSGEHSYHISGEGMMLSEGGQDGLHTRVQSQGVPYSTPSQVVDKFFETEEDPGDLGLNTSATELNALGLKEARRQAALEAYADAKGLEGKDRQAFMNTMSKVDFDLVAGERDKNGTEIDRTLRSAKVNEWDDAYTLEQLKKTVNIDDPVAVQNLEAILAMGSLDDGRTVLDIYRDMDITDTRYSELASENLNRAHEISSVRENVGNMVESEMWSAMTKTDTQKYITEQTAIEFDALEVESAKLLVENKIINERITDNYADLEEAAKKLKDFNKHEDGTVKERLDKITSKQYSTQEEEDAAREEANRILDEYNALADTYNIFRRDHGLLAQAALQAGNELEDTNMAMDDFAPFMEHIGRNHGVVTQMAAGVGNAAIDLVMAFPTIAVAAWETTGMEAINFVDWMRDKESPDAKAYADVMDAYNMFSSGEEFKRGYVKPEAEYEGASFWWEWMEDLDNWQYENITSQVEEAPRYEDIKTVSDFGEWTAVMAAGQAPQLALMMATGGLGIAASTAIMGANAAGAKYDSMRMADMEFKRSGGLYGQDFGFAQMFLTAGIVGAAEGFSERITFGQLKKVKGLFKGIGAKDFYKGIKGGYAKQLRNTLLNNPAVIAKSIGRGAKDLFEEGFSEVAATLSENQMDVINGVEGAYIYNNVDESFVSGVMISALIKGGGGVGVAALSPFRSADTDAAIEYGVTRGKEIDKLLQDPNLPEAERLKLIEEQGEITFQTAKNMELDVKRVGNMTDPHIKELIDIKAKQIEAQSEANKLRKKLADGDMTQEQFDLEIKKLGVVYDAVTDRKTDILNQYEITEIDTTYEKFMDSLNRNVKALAEKMGKPIDTEEGHFDKFDAWLEANDNEMSLLEEAERKVQEKVDDESLSKEEREQADMDLHAIKQHIELKIAASKPGLISTGRPSNRIGREEDVEGEKAGPTARSMKYGAQVPVLNDNGDVIGYKMFVNKTMSIDNGQYTTGSHEFLHTVLHNTLKQDRVVSDAIGNELLTILEDSDQTEWKNERAKKLFYARLARYKNRPNRGEEVLTITSEMLQRGDVKFKQKTLKRIGTGLNRVAARAGKGATIKFDTAEDVKQFVIDYSISLKNGGINQSIIDMAAEGAGGAIIEKARKESERLKEDADANEGQRRIEEWKAEMSFSEAVDNALENDPDLLNIFDKTITKPDGTKITSKDEWLKYPHLMEEAYNAILYSPVLNGLIRSNLMAELKRAKVSKEHQAIILEEANKFIQDVKENLSLRLLTQFDPAKNDSLFGWLAGTQKGFKSAIRHAVLDVMKERAQEIPTLSYDAPMGDSGGTYVDILEGEVVDEGGGVGVEIPVEERKISDDLNLKEEFLEKIDKVVDKADLNFEEIKDKGYKGIKEDVLGIKKVPVMKDGKPVLNKKGKPKTKLPTKTSEVVFIGKLNGVLKEVSNEFGVNPKKVPSRLTLTQTERDSALDYIVEHAEALHRHRSEQHTSKGKSTGVPPKYLEAHYDRVMDPETGEQVRTGTEPATRLGFEAMDTQGTKLWALKDQTIPEFMLEFGVEGTMENGKFVETSRFDTSDKAFDGVIHGQVAVTSAGLGNETVRQQEIEKSPELPRPVTELVAIIGDGKGAMSFSDAAGKKSMQEIGRFDSSLDPKKKFLFWDRAPQMADNIVSKVTLIEEQAKKDKKRIAKSEKFSLENIKIVVTETYGDVFSEKELDTLAKAMHKVAMTNKIKASPKTQVDMGEQLVDGLLTLAVNQETVLKTFFGTEISTVELMDPTGEKIKLHRGLVKTYVHRRVQEIKDKYKNTPALNNLPKEQKDARMGAEIIEMLELLRQQSSTAAKVGGNRNQLFLQEEFLNDVMGSIPGLNFGIKKGKGKTKTGGSAGFALQWDTITYDSESTATRKGPDASWFVFEIGETWIDPDLTGAKVEVNPNDILSIQTSDSVVQEFIDDHFLETKSIEEREAIVTKARVHLNDMVAYYVGLYEDGIIGAEDLQMAAATMLSNMQPTLARAAMPKYIADDLLPKNWKDMEKSKVEAWVKKNHKGDLKPVFEHMQPRVSVVIDLFRAHLFEGGVKNENINDRLANYDVAIIPHRMDMVLKDAGLNSALVKGQTLDMPSWIRYYNELTMKLGINKKGKSVMSGLIGIGSNVGQNINTDQAFKDAQEAISKPNNAVRDALIADGMILGSMSALEGTKGLSALDFDDTLATTKSNVIFTKEGKTKVLTAEDFAKEGTDLIADGWVPDFSEFNQVVDGKTAPLFNKALKLATKFGTKNMFVVTARDTTAAPAIKQFLDANGLNIPIENIIGLGKSEASAKANWIAEKISEGYNDFYFADDAIQNVDAVQEMLDRYDVKGKVQQAKIQFSEEGPRRFVDIINEGARDLDSDLNIILEETKGVYRQKRFSAAKARKRGKNKGKWKFFLPPSAEDLKGLIYPMLGKGKTGERHHKWFKEHVMDPFAKGIRHLNMVTQAIANDIKKLKKALPEVKRKLKDNVPGTEFSFQDAIRVYNWDKAGFDIPGLSTTDKNRLIATVNNDPQLKAFADGLNTVMQQSAQNNLEPGNDWIAGTIESDISDILRAARQIYLKEWQEKVDIIFSEENLNKIEAVFGSNHREALEDILFRMRTGSTRNFGRNRLVNGFTQWLNGSIGATMFFNARSAVLQQLSNINFINWHDNNPIKAAAAFANFPQFVKDVVMIFNSPWLKQRRGGIGTDLNAAELLRDMQGSKNPMKSLIAHLLRIGFTPTQVGDSIAIATGGATMYRNRVKTYLKEGMTQAEAEAKAFEDMMEIAEETQQSTREDKISQQQASPLGKFILAFQNITMQYNRLMKRAAQDLINGRGDPKEHISKIAYYGMVQNMIFYGLQQALFAALFGDDEEDQINEKDKTKLINSMMDSVLRGSGIAGAVVSTIKNTIIKFMQEKEKMDDDEYYTDMNEANIIVEALNLSPPLGIKARKWHSAIKTWHYNDDVIRHMSKTDIDNPMYEMMFNLTEATFNLPLHRLYNKSMNIREALNSDNEDWERIAMFMGWSRWSFGIRNQDVITARDEIKEIKAVEREEKREVKKQERAVEKATEEAAIEKGFLDDQQKERDQNQEDITCAAVNKAGKRCGTKVKGSGNYCTIHEEVPQTTTKAQCSHIKTDGNRCKMQTTNKSGKCYYHD